MSLFTRLSYLSRKCKLKMFYDVMKPTENTRILDVGAEVHPRDDRNLQLIDSYDWKKNISALNYSSEHVESIMSCYPEISAVQGNACDLPWPDKYFDVVYSNAVIEHVGDFNMQKKMASEIMRVGKRWFVTTPNRWYPFEFHMRLPFVTWLPGQAYLYAGRIVSYDHIQGKYMFGLKKKNFRLMSSSELNRCFPTSKIVQQRVTFMPETLIAIGSDIS